MRHRVSGRQLSRTSSHRKALRRNLAASLIEHGAIRTTEAKAKELRRFVERVITVAKAGTLHARRRVISMIQNRHAVDEDRANTEPWIKSAKTGKTVVDVLFDEIAPRYADRPGGYTRIIRLSDRRIGDAGVQVLLQLVEETAPRADEEAPSGGGRRRKRAAKRLQAAGAVGQAEPVEEESPAPAEAEESVEAKEPASEEPAADEQGDEAPDETDTPQEKSQ